MQYEIEVHYRGCLPRWTVIAVDSNFEACEIAHIAGVEFTNGRRPGVRLKWG